MKKERYELVENGYFIRDNELEYIFSELGDIEVLLNIKEKEIIKLQSQIARAMYCLKEEE